MPFLPAFEKKMSAKVGAITTRKPIIGERPRGVFAARSAGEVLAGDENLRALVARIVEHERRIGIARRRAPPVEEQKIAVAGALDALQKLLGNDLVGIHVGAIERRGQCGQVCERVPLGLYLPLRPFHVRMSTKCPAMAAAAAISGETRCVRPPRPWRPSKLRLLVEAQRSPGERMSGFMARHIEQPGSRHSNPASRKIAVQALRLGLRLHRLRAGNHHRAHRASKPCSRGDACRGAQILNAPLVQEPMKTRSIAISSSGVPAFRPMYSSARSNPLRSFSFAASPDRAPWP